MSIHEQEHDPIKNPRPEDLHAYGVVPALLWFSALLAIGLLVYWALF